MAQRRRRKPNKPIVVEETKVLTVFDRLDRLVDNHYTLLAICIRLENAIGLSRMSTEEINKLIAEIKNTGYDNK